MSNTRSFLDQVTESRAQMAPVDEVAKNTALVKLAELKAKCKDHRGGVLYAHERVLSRNTYTINPRTPKADAQDREKMALMEQLHEMAEQAIASRYISRHSAQLRGYLIHI